MGNFIRNLSVYANFSRNCRGLGDPNRNVMLSVEFSFLKMMRNKVCGQTNRILRLEKSVTTSHAWYLDFFCFKSTRKTHYSAVSFFSFFNSIKINKAEWRKGKT